MTLFGVALGGGAIFVLGGHGSSAPLASQAAVTERPAYAAALDRLTFLPARRREALEGTAQVVTGALGDTAMERASSLMSLPRHGRWTFLAREGSIALPVVHGETSAAGLEAAPVTALTLPILVFSATAPASSQAREGLHSPAARPAAFTVERPAAGAADPGVTIDPTLAPLDVPLAAMVPASAGLPDAPAPQETRTPEVEIPTPEKAGAGRRPRATRAPSEAVEEKAPKAVARTQSKADGVARSRLIPPSAPSPEARGDPDWWPFESVRGR